MNNRPRPSAQFLNCTRPKKCIRFGSAAFRKSTPTSPSDNAPPFRLPAQGGSGDVGAGENPGRGAHGGAREGWPGGTGTVGPGLARGGKPVVSPRDGGPPGLNRRGGHAGLPLDGGTRGGGPVEPPGPPPDGGKRGRRHRTGGPGAAPGRGGDGAAATRGDGVRPGPRATEPLL